MGNYVSCTLATPMGKSPSRVTKVIFPTGEIRRLYEPTKAAELMLETPNYFVVNTKSVQINRRFSALNADEDLEMGNVYVLFHMKRLNTPATAADLGMLFMAANSCTKRASIRVSPDCGGGDLYIVPSTAAAEAATKLNLEEMEDFSTPEFKHRLSLCRSKKPQLETIVEEPVCLR